MLTLPKHQQTFHQNESNQLNAERRCDFWCGDTRRRGIARTWKCASATANLAVSLRGSSQWQHVRTLTVWSSWGFHLDSTLPKVAAQSAQLLGQSVFSNDTCFFSVRSATGECTIASPGIGPTSQLLRNNMEQLCCRKQLLASLRTSILPTNLRLQKQHVTT